MIFSDDKTCTHFQALDLITCQSCLLSDFFKVDITIGISHLDTLEGESVETGELLTQLSGRVMPQAKWTGPRLDESGQHRDYVPLETACQRSYSYKQYYALEQLPDTGLYVVGCPF